MIPLQCKIAKNTFYDYVNCGKRFGELMAEELASDENIEERFADRETTYAAYKILHGMSEPYREVFWLRTFGELSFSQIGALSGKTESWARVTYYRAKLKIREELE